MDWEKTSKTVGILFGIAAAFFLFVGAVKVASDSQLASGSTYIIGSLILFGAAFFLYTNQKVPKQPNFLGIGAIFIVFGIAANATALWVLGIAFSIKGLVDEHRSRTQPESKPARKPAKRK